MRFYSKEKLNALQAYLKLESDREMRVWSDNSITLSDDEKMEYYVTKGTRKYEERVGRKNGFNISRTRGLVAG
ncbi:hypothetical protein [Paenibacillus abyssi]|uniref:Uncharacterized protein n=1 Tax=Paenibacillus abyssi TaxID=1340531 RepID=A0A917G1S5_9BACL|nr:hypothetical protein [Paenibacillus abyssi]GGG17872.1 hypothetical protein GCM10010916_38350 [Paenibacillus abyssi]